MRRPPAEPLGGAVDVKGTRPFLSIVWLLASWAGAGAERLTTSSPQVPY